jgi:hypothetical protein
MGGHVLIEVILDLTEEDLAPYASVVVSDELWDVEAGRYVKADDPSKF